jgi:hypothetical protein
MIHVDEIRKGDGQIQFSLAVLGTPELSLKSDAPAVDSEPFSRSNELHLSGLQLFAGFLSASRAAGLLVWAFLKLWLFAE